MDMPEGFKIFEIAQNILHHGKYSNRVKELVVAEELMKEMAEALAYIEKHSQAPHYGGWEGRVASEAIEDYHQTATIYLKRFKEWK